jgi:hypothetical protein
MLKLLMKDGVVVVRNGKPVYIDEDNGNQEVEFDAPGAMVSIARLKTEAKTHREKAEELQGQVDVFKDLNPEEARKALQTVKDLGDNQLIKAGKLEEVKTSLNKEWGTKLEAESKRADEATAALHSEKVGGAFARSKFIAEQLTIPADMVQAMFGKSFKIGKNGAIEAYDNNGNQIFSKANPGEPAPFEEALGIVIGGYAGRDAILKSKVGSGGSTGAGKGGNGGGGNGKTRAEVDAMNPMDKGKFFREGGKIVEPT